MILPDIWQLSLSDCEPPQGGSSLIGAMRPLHLLLLAPLVVPAAAEAAESIVGTWATPGRCGRPLSTVVVDPMGFGGEDFSCDFDSVARTGNEVRWRGTCDFGDANGAEKVTVTARLEKGRLRYRINKDGWNGPLQRCPD